MSVFNEIEKMSGLLGILKPELSDYLGVLINPEDGSETTEPAIYLEGNFVPDSTLPRVVISYNGSQNGHVTRMRAYQEENPDYIEGEEEAEFLYFIDREYHTEFSLSFAIDSGDTTEVLTGNRYSSNMIARKIRTLLGRHSIRDQIHEQIETGVDYIAAETPQTDQDGVVLVGSSVMVVNFTTLDIDTEEQTGMIERVISKGDLYNVSDEDPNPIDVPNDTTDPDA